VKHWRTAQERSAQLEQDCDDFAGQMRLVEALEEGRNGRWILKGIRYSWAEVVTLRNGIYVGGDVETVVFVGGGDRAARPRGRVYWMATRSYDYAQEKADIGDTAPREWDEAVARWNVLYHRRHGDIDRDAAREIYLSARDGEHAFREAIYENTEDSELCDMGMCVSRSVYMATAILRQLARLFDAEDFRATAHEWFRMAA
jgi:hypothetical protein